MSARRSMHDFAHHHVRFGRLFAVGATLAGALAATAPAAMAAAQPSPDASRLVAVGAAPALPNGARALGAVLPSTQVSGGVALKLPDEAAVSNFIDAVSNPKSSSYHQYLAKGEFT